MTVRERIKRRDRHKAVDAVRLIARLKALQEQMVAQCSNPPCQHAQGIGLAINEVEMEADLW